MKKQPYITYHNQVFFRVSKDVVAYPAGMKKGSTDMIWVTTRTNRKRDILAAAKDKIAHCYGLELIDPEIYYGFKHTGYY